jgi:hypothetical protein
MKFASEKSELLHFSHAYANCELLLRHQAVVMRFVTDARFLGIWLNNRLFWKTHLAKIKRKIATQMLAFSKLAALAWKTSVPSAKQVYAIVIRSVLAYAAPS